MALDSIAKLAVIITGDESPLNRSLKRGEEMVNQFSLRVSASYAKMAAKGALMATGGAMFSGLMRGSDSLFGLERRMIAVGEQYDELLKKQGRFVKASVDSTQFISKKWELLGQNIGDAFAVLLTRLGPTIDAINSLFDHPMMKGIQGMRANRAEVERSEKGLKAAQAAHERAKKRMEELAKLQETLADSADDTRRRNMEDLQHRAEQLEESLRTPQETFRATMAELDMLLSKGVIFGDTFDRAAQKARQDLHDATHKKPKPIEPIGAVERYTMAGFSAVQQAKAATEQQKPNRAEVAIEKHTQKMATGIEQLNQELADWVKSQPLGVTNLN